MSINRANEPPVVIRAAAAGDAPALVRLAALDSRRVPDGRLLVAEVEAELWAAVSSRGAVIADPFRPTADLVSLLCLRATQLGLGESTHEQPWGLAEPTRWRWPRRVARVVGSG